MDIDRPHVSPQDLPATLPQQAPAPLPSDAPGTTPTLPSPRLLQPATDTTHHTPRDRGPLAEARPDIAQAAPGALPHGEPRLQAGYVGWRHADDVSDGAGHHASKLASDRASDGDTASDSDSDSIADCISSLIRLSQKHDRPENETAWKAAMPPLARSLIGLSFGLPAMRDAVLAEASSLMSGDADLGEIDLQYGRTVLHWVALMGDATVTDYLLRRGGAQSIHRADLGGLTPLSLVMRFRIAPIGMQRPPQTAAIVGLLLDHGAQLQALAHHGCELLYLSDLTPGLAQRVVGMGVPVDAGGSDRETPMLRACLRGNWLLVSALIDLGANVRAHGRFGSTALHMVQLPEPLARRLLALGADLDARDMMRHTPLAVCCETGNLPVARLLLQYGASADAKTADGVSILDIARTTGGEIERLIREALMLQPALKLASE